MVNDANLEKIKAREKVKVWALLLLFCGALSGVWEYYKTQTSLSEILVVYVPNVTNNINNGVVEIKPVEQNIKTVEEEAQKQETKTDVEEDRVVENLENVEVKQEEVNVDNESNRDVVGELLNYMGDVKERLNNVTMPEIALDKVIERVEEIKPKEEIITFKEGELEIYDTNKGVVAVERVEIVKDDDESQILKKDIGQVIENNKESVDTENAEVIDGTIDMMKSIVERNMEEKKE